jgi:signal transduction histidine kinase
MNYANTPTHIDQLLERANRFLVQNNLVEALPLAQDAGKLSYAENYTEGIIGANLLLSKLSLQNARYLSRPTALALEYIEKTKALKQETSLDNKVAILLQYGEVHLYNNAFSTALPYLQEALVWSEKSQGLNNIILTHCALSRLAVKQNKFEEALAYLEASLALVNQKDSHIEVQVLNELYHERSQVYLRRQEYSMLHDSCLKSLELCVVTGDIEKEMVATNSLGIYYATQLDHRRAMEHFLVALDISKQIDYRAMTGQYLINIATVYAQLYNFDDARDRYQTLLEQYDDILADNTRLIVYNNLGNIQLTLERPKSAQPYFEQSLTLARSIQYKEMVAHSLAQLSRTNILLGNLEVATQQMEEAAQLVEALGDTNAKPINLINRGSILFHQKQFSEAIYFLSKGVTAAKRMQDDASERRGYRLLSKLYQEQNDFEQALKYQTVYSEAREHFYKEMRNRQSIDLEIKYAIKEKQKEIESLRTENQYKDLLLEQKDQLAKQNTQLMQVNEELRQFAYAASHDLKEPLRMIGSYTQLIHKKYEPQVDETSASYFQYVSEGVKRMNNLLDGLLKYATIGKSEEDMEEVDLKQAAELAIINLRISISESHAIIEMGTLPTIRSVKSLWIQLFQNLISNAIKFRKPDMVPKVSIGYQYTDRELIVSVKDNGIGIQEEYSDRIFIIFQRLHSRDAFEGTGIGLAICQKIMKRLDGRIWVESVPGEGAVFYCGVPV